MCTVTYIPISEGYILTSSRDENPNRSLVLYPQAYNVGKQTLYYPKELLSGGTWIAHNGRKRTACLLNGAFVAHTKAQAYKRSRGIVIPSYFEFDHVDDFIQSFDCNGMEPFTLIMCERDQLYEFRWNGIESFSNKLNSNVAHIWSSATLYDLKIQKMRELWFENWLQVAKDKREPFDFHLHAGTGDRMNDVHMWRSSDLQTVSISSVHCSATGSEFRYLDLLHDVPQQLISKANA